MIVSKTPLRISFVGGGSDYFNPETNIPGRVIVTTINKYMYVLCNKRYNNTVRVSYSETEIVKKTSHLKHLIIKEALRYCKIRNGVEICTVADVPSSGSGLASSSALTVGLINVINAYKGKKLNKYNLANHACIIEREKCKKPIGFQDQFSTAYGGFNKIEFFRNKNIKVSKINLSSKKLKSFNNKLILFYTGINRQADNILGKIQKSGKKFLNYEKLSYLAKCFEKELINENYKSCGEILNENWDIKKSLNKEVSSLNLDNIYQTAISSGAYGGKILGAGGGGYFLFLTEEKFKKKIIKNLNKLQTIKFSFETEGSKIL